MKAGRRTLVVGVLLAALGMFLAWDAWVSGSLFRYQLVGYAAGAALCVPLLSRLSFGARAGWFWRRLAFVTVPVVGCLLLGEGVMRLFVTREPPAELVRDPRLGHVMVAGTSGTDANGFRNVHAAGDAEVLFVGDSQTWGFGVTAEQTFAHRFGELTGRRTYQLANGSYGTVQYLELVRRGLALAPRAKRCVVTFYFGNDIIDARDYTGLEGAESVRVAGVPPFVRENEFLRGPRRPNATIGTIDRVLEHSVLLDRLAGIVKSQLRGGVMDQQAGSVQFDHEHAATVLLPDYREPLVDPGESAVEVGLAVTARCFERIAALCRARGCECVVLCLPSKEFVYAEWLGDELPRLAKLHAAEAAARARWFADLEAAGLRCIDLNADLVRATRDRPFPWHHTGDGHINAAGHELVAEVLQREW